MFGDQKLFRFDFLMNKKIDIGIEFKTGITPFQIFEWNTQI